MNLLDKVNELGRKYGVSASKNFGQNFLIDQTILDKIVDSSTTNNKVIEVGPGLGFLTGELINKYGHIDAYELDRDMIKVLKSEYSPEVLTLHEGDFTKASFDWEGKKDIIANIPYNITTQILFYIFKHKEKFNKVTLMVQKEYAYRLNAWVGTSEYGKLSLTTQLYTSKIELITKVPRESFSPAPKVKSAVIQLTLNDDEVDPKLVEFIKRCFMQRRKTLLNNLKQFASADEIRTLFEKLEIKPTARPQEIELETFKKLYSHLGK